MQYVCLRTQSGAEKTSVTKLIGRSERQTTQRCTKSTDCERYIIYLYSISFRNAAYNSEANSTDGISNAEHWHQPDGSFDFLSFCSLYSSNKKVVEKKIWLKWLYGYKEEENFLFYLSEIRKACTCPSLWRIRKWRVGWMWPI